MFCFGFFSIGVCFSQDATTGATPPYKKPLLDIKITTDKEFYSVNDSIKVTVFNNIDESIYSHACSLTPTFCINHIGSFDGLKYYAYCDYPDCVYDIDVPCEIKPGESVQFPWQPRYYDTVKKQMLDLNPGDYCLVISYQIKDTRDSSKWQWLFQNSNKFTILEESLEDVLIN